MFNQERPDFSEKDYINKLLVDKYQSKMTVNPENYGIKYFAENKNEDSCNNNHDCGCYYCKNYEYEEPEEMPNEDDELNENKEEEKDWCNPNTYYERLGVDILCVHIGQGLLPLFLNCYENIVVPKIINLRKDLTDEYGYIIPVIRFLDTTTLDNSYEIYVRGQKVFDNNIETNLDESMDDVLKYSHIADTIVQSLKTICLEYVKVIMTKTDTLKLMEIVRSQDPTLVNDLVPVFLSAIDLKNIFAELIKSGISIKDIIRVFELLNDYARETQDIKILTDKLKFNINNF